MLVDVGPISNPVPGTTRSPRPFRRRFIDSLCAAASSRSCSDMSDGGLLGSLGGGNLGEDAPKPISYISFLVSFQQTSKFIDHVPASGIERNGQSALFGCQVGHVGDRCVIDVSFKGRNKIDCLVWQLSLPYGHAYILFSTDNRAIPRVLQCTWVCRSQLPAGIS